VGSFVFQDESNGKPLTPEQVCDKYLTQSHTRLIESIGENEMEVIGSVEGQRVYFCRAKGIYFYTGHLDALDTLEIWITGGTYPKGY
jgi:hypothetical protein